MLIQSRYKIKRTLGEGAFATTYLCEDTQEGQDVAIKAMRLTQVDAWKSFELFEREARVLKSLDHPGVPDFYDVFKTEDKETTTESAFHIVQEFIDGASLQATLDDGKRLSPSQLDKLVLGILDVLEYLHTQSPPVYHRDIKPSNIIIKADDAPVLIDFGSVCDGWREEGPTGSTVAGTYGYMPPEQYMGQVSARSDLYALAATLVHVMTGREPATFSFEDGRLELPEDLNCTPELRALIDQCLETAPSARPQTVQEARERLHRQQEPETSKPAMRQRRKKRATKQTTPAPSKAQTTTATPSTDIAPTTNSVHAMTIVEAGVVQLGNAPRNPNGRHASLYTEMSKQTPWAMHFFMTIFTMGFWILLELYLYYSGGKESKEEHRELFINGVYVVGEIKHTLSDDGLHTLMYTFEHNGQVIRGESKTTRPITGLVPGDPVGVLYNKRTPTTSYAVLKQF